MNKEYIYNVEIIDVTDGDTLTVMADLGFNIFHKIKIRLNGVNTPESRTKHKKEKALGLKAKEFTKSFIKDNDCQIKVFKSGKYGRWLSEVFVYGKGSLNKTLLKAGLARPYSGGKREPWFKN